MADTQPMKFTARTSYTVEYPPKDLRVHDDVRTSFMLRADMNHGLEPSLPPCKLDSLTTYERDFYAKQAALEREKALADAVSAEGGGEALPRVRFNSISAYQAEYQDKAVKVPNYAKPPTQIDFFGPEGIPPPMPLENRTSYTAEFAAKPIIRDADVSGHDSSDTLPGGLPDMHFSSGTTYRASFVGQPLDKNLMQADEPVVKSTPEFRKFSTERGDEYDIGLPEMPIEKRTSYTAAFEPKQIIPVREPTIGQGSGSVLPHFKFTAGTTYRTSFVGTKVDKNVLGADSAHVKQDADFRTFRTEHDSY